ncbi:anti sigma factor C-terminal domain-containing protein [Brevibacillus dissolubilis]|uniref:anti sigma factor C-terminal domain-containing protein n=1 Tax=Brevibacillus dissolubilis TaxID=1844116 RepID=UPI001115B912|nr:anti sigma factor C-terminal domain-containing protein [Brevibacillus dissolubilis]
MNHPFSGQDDGDFSALIKKARRKTILRNVAISLVISVLVLFVGTVGNSQLLQRSADHALRDIGLFKQISGPNLYESGYVQRHGFLNGMLEYRTYKIVEGIPVVWSTQTVEYNAWGNFSRIPGNYSPIQIPDTELTKQHFDYYRPYNQQNGQREMMFYLPGVDYGGKWINDLPSVDQMDAAKLVELGISLDQSYTLAEVKAMLPAGVRPVWYWVDTYNDRAGYEPQTMEGGTHYPMPEQAFSVYGFGIDPERENVTEEDFLQMIEIGLGVGGKYHGEYQRIYDYLRQEKDKPSSSDVKLLGVVVTGTAESLKALKGKPYVKAAVLGAVISKY